MDTGNTFCAFRERLLNAVQPRGYGEHFFDMSDAILKGGSAPWIRGTHFQLLLDHSPLRFSPVDTGNTNTTFGNNHQPSVQPRGYGEHQVQNGKDGSDGGSAPWIRGTLA